MRRVAAAIAIPWVCVALAQPEVELGGQRWRPSGDARVQELDGREALRMRNGAAQAIDLAFANGTIEFEFRGNGARCFAGVVFRAGAGGVREHFYLRPHNSGRFDAAQYTPVFHDNSAWQLYPEHNAGLEIPRDRWLHVRLVVAGPRLDVHFDRETSPTLSIPRLLTERRDGAVALSSFCPGEAAADVLPIAFAGVAVTPDAAAYDWPAVAGPDPGSGLVPRWAVSDPFPEAEVPTRVPEVGEWREVAADAEGRVNLSRHVAFPAGANSATVLARTRLVSDRARVVRLGFGFSDRGTLFLNGRPVFRGDNTYLSRSKRYLGVMRVDNDMLWLSLDEGVNELVFAVSESFGGWGVTARLLDRDGVRFGDP